MAGKHRRLERLFNRDTGRIVLAPIDHGIWSGPIPGIEHPREVLQAVIAGGADAVLLNPGYARDTMRYIPPDVGLVLRVSTGTELAEGADQEFLFCSIERAIRLGADAVAVTVYPTGSDADNALANLGRVIDTAERYGLPVLAEFLPLGDAGWKVIAHMARIGYEMGADVIKTSYTGDAESFTKVVERCPAPIIVAGGEPVGGPGDVVQMAYDAVRSGAKGTAIGRNTWQNDSPEAMVSAIHRAVHDQDIEAARTGTRMIRFIV